MEQARIESSGTDARIAGRDFIEIGHAHFHGPSEPPAEGKEIAPCRKCRKPIWVHALTCTHCGYDPAVEVERARLKHQQFLEEHRGEIILSNLWQVACWGISAWLAFEFLTWEWAREGEHGPWSYAGFLVGFIAVTLFGGEVLRDAGHRALDWARSQWRKL